jgi:transposase
VTAIARLRGHDPKIVRKYILRGFKPAVYGRRQVGRPGELLPVVGYIDERFPEFPGLTAMRLLREIRERGYAGAYPEAKRFVAAIRPNEGQKPLENRFETPPSLQAQMDFARFVVVFEDEPVANRVIWLFSLALGHSWHLFARFVLHQDLQTLRRCHMAAFESMGGVPVEILYDRMKTAVTVKDGDSHIVYNGSFPALAQHYASLRKACRPYRAKTKGKVERPFRYIREDFFLGRSFRDTEDLNRQLSDWLDTLVNVRQHGTTCSMVRKPSPPSSPICRPCLPAPPTRGSGWSAPSAKSGSWRAAEITTACRTGRAAWSGPAECR